MAMTARPDQPIVVAGPLVWHALEVGSSLINLAAMIINMTILIKSGGQQTGQMTGQGRGKATAPPLQVIMIEAAKLGHKGGCSSMPACKWRMRYSLVLVHWHELPGESLT